MSWPSTAEFTKLFDLLARHAPELRPACRWLALVPVLGDRRTTVLLDARPPTAGELTRLLRLLERRSPDLLPTGYWLTESSEHAEAAWAELQLDRLLAADVEAWEHPSQILEWPRPDFARLLASCVERRKRARGARREHVSRVEAKLERAVRIADSAERRLARRRRRRKKTGRGS